MVDLGHADLGDFPHERNHKVHGCADGREVVHRDQGIHLELGRAQEALDHGKPKGLANDAGNLVDDANPDKLDLANGSDDDTDNNGGDIEEDLKVRLRNTETPAGKENGNGCGSLAKNPVSFSLTLSASGRTMAPTLSIWIKATLR
jgi:hypothetical protein